MKKIYILTTSLLIGVASIFFACQKELFQTPDNVINFDVKKSPSEYTVAEKALYLEARSLMDKHIILKDGQYSIKTNNPLEVGVSKEVFEYFQKIMTGTNVFIKSTTMRVVAKSDKSIILLKNISGSVKPGTLMSTSNQQRAQQQPISFFMESEGEVTGGGINQIVSYWYGFDLYLSYTTLNDIAAGVGFASVVAGVVPEPTMASKVVAIVLAGCSAAAWVTANHYPNGVIITAPWPVFPLYYCVDLELNSQ